jgi:DNA polymerase-1
MSDDKPNDERGDKPNDTPKDKPDEERGEARGEARGDAHGDAHGETRGEEGGAEGGAEGALERMRLYLVDGSSFIHRAYHAIRSLSSSSGVPTNAVFGFTSMLIKLLQEREPTHLAVAFDGPTAETFRVEIYPEYKANRPPAPEDLVPQFGLCRQVTEALRIPALEDRRVEADDIIATLTRQAVEAGFSVTIVSSDKDLMQLVSEHVVLWDTMSDRTYDVEAVRNKWGVTPERVRDLLALMGDSSDNIPGVAGIGQKTAATLLYKHGDLEGVLAAAPGIKGKRGKTLVEQAEQARLSARLVALDAAVPVEVGIEGLVRGQPDLDAITELFSKLDFNRMLEQVRDLAGAGAGTGTGVGASAGSGGGTEPAGALDRERYETIIDAERLAEVLARASEGGDLALDLETTSLSPPDADIVGFALCWAPGEAAYVPVAHRGLGVGDQLACDAVLEALAPLLRAEQPRLHMQNHKYETAVLRRYGLEIGGVGCDPMIASYLLDPSASSHGLDALALRELGHQMIPFKEVCGTGKSTRPFDEVDIPLATRYAAEDAEATFLLAQRLEPRIHEAELQGLMWDVEVPLARVLAIMELHGVVLDLPRLAQLSQQMNERLAALEKEVAASAGMRVNLNSPKQLQGLLFDHLGLTPVRKTKTGYSTDAEVLAQLADAHPVAAMIHEYRQVQKLKGTYVDALPRLVSKRTGRLHTSYNQAVAATGRLSSSDPNLQNIPIRTELGREIRRAFVAPPGCLLVAADYSQIELRVLAHLSGDEVLTEAFRRGEDVHARTATEVFGVDPGQVDREQRRVAKAVNFGVVYGQGAFGLARQLEIPRGEAQGYIDAYFERYQGVQAYMERVIEQAREQGAVSTILGRRRPLRDLGSKNPSLRAAAERMARNTPIQGSAADIIKLAMLRCQRRLEADFPEARMLMTVHDELVFEVSEAQAEALGVSMAEEMGSAWELDVPLEVDVGTGANWLDAH